MNQQARVRRVREGPQPRVPPAIAQMDEVATCCVTQPHAPVEPREQLPIRADISAGGNRRRWRSIGRSRALARRGGRCGRSGRPAFPRGTSCGRGERFAHRDSWRIRILASAAAGERSWGRPNREAAEPIVVVVEMLDAGVIRFGGRARWAEVPSLTKSRHIFPAAAVPFT